MKLGKSSLLLLLVGISLVVAVSLGTASINQLDERDLIKEELAQVKQKLNDFNILPLSASKTALIKELDSVNSLTEKQKSVLSLSLHSIEADRWILDVAKTSEVEIKSISSSGISSASLEKLQCDFMPITIQAKGEPEKLIAFVANLNRETNHGCVKSVKISIQEESAELPVISIQMELFRYQGD